MTPEVNPFRLDGQIALITGGGTGLGLGIARSMVRAGARVILVGRTGGPLEAAAAELGGSARCEVYNVTETDRAPQLVERAAAHFGQISILVNNAGIHLKKPALETTEAELVRVLNTHVTGAHALCRAAIPAMLERGGGCVLFIASMAALFGIPHVIAYSAAKSACLGLIRSLAVELSPRNIRVNGIAPGWIDSRMMREALAADPERQARILGRTPMNRFGEPCDVGQAAVYLCSPAAKFVTGVVLPVDGGVSIGF